MLLPRHTKPSSCQHRKYMMTCVEYDELLGDGSCAICGSFETADQRHHLDHEGGGNPNWRVRGIICGPCNTRVDIRSDSALPGRDRYRANPYWKQLPAPPSEPLASGVRIRWGRIARRDHTTGLWFVASRSWRSFTWTELVEEFGPLLLDVD